MKPFVLSTDSASDMPKEFHEKYDIDCHSLFYTIDGETYGNDKQLDIKDFYARVRAGSIPTTTGTNPEDSYDKFVKRVENGQDIIHVAFSEVMSASYQNAVIAKNMVPEKYPDAKITVIDSKCGTVGQGLLVHKANQLRLAGKSYEEVVDWIEANKLHIGHQILVDDLNHLCRGGRISKSKAIIGSIVGFKPVINIDDNGRLINITKIRGQKKGLNWLIDSVGNLQGSYADQNDTIFISHADALENAQYVGEGIKAKYGTKEILYSYFSPTIGAHVGPGTVAVAFMQETREKEN